jgi:hypothetical protein
MSFLNMQILYCIFNYNKYITALQYIFKKYQETACIFCRNMVQFRDDYSNFYRERKSRS